MQGNSAYTGVDFSLKSGFTKIVLTPGLPLHGFLVAFQNLLWVAVIYKLDGVGWVTETLKSLSYCKKLKNWKTPTET